MLIKTAKMKYIFGFLLTLFLINSLFGQDLKTIVFYDTIYHNPVHGVMVFSNGNFLAVSDEVGACRINDTITQVFCKYPGYKSSPRKIADCDTCKIYLSTNYNILEEVEVEANYNAEKHLLSLLKESQQAAYKLDTNIYYKFNEVNTIPELKQTEIFTGILRVENKGYSKKGNLIFIAEISNYYNTIEQDICKENSLNNIFTKFLHDILYPRNIKRIKRHNKIERSFYSEDSLSFSLITKRNNIKTEYDFISFVNNKIKTREFAATIQNNSPDKSYYKTDYSLSPISIPEYIFSSREYFLENGVLVKNYIELEKIDNPGIEKELNIFLYNKCSKELVEKAKTKFQDIVIPCEFVEE